MDWGGVEDELDGCRRAALINLEPTRQRLSAPKGMMANTGFGFGFDEIRFGASSADVLPVDTVPPTLLTITGITNGVSQGGTATWDNGTTTNWDRGPGFEAPIAWDNTGSNTAMFGGTAGTVTLAGEVSLSGLTVNLPTRTINARIHDTLDPWTEPNAKLRPAFAESLLEFVDRHVHGLPRSWLIATRLSSRPWGILPD